MNSELDNLDCGIVANIHSDVLRKRHLRHADGTGPGCLGRTKNSELRLHDVDKVDGTAIRSVSADSEVDEQLRLSMPSEPAWLHGDSAASDGPIRSILCKGDTTTCCAM